MKGMVAICPSGKGNMNTMHITIGIPVRNGEPFLEAALSSALTQSLPAEEILVVDDASTDRSAEICRSSRWEGRVRYEFNAHRTGFADAWNRTVRLASCEYVSILHQDDLLRPDFIQTMKDMMTAHPEVGHFFSACQYIDAEGAPLPGAGAIEGDRVRLHGHEYARSYLLRGQSSGHIHRCPGLVTAKKIIVEQCPFRAEAGLIADDDFFYRIGRFTDAVGTSRVLSAMRQHSASETTRMKNLSLTLARDYLFQIRYHDGPESLLGHKERTILRKIGLDHLHRAQYEALLNGDAEQLMEVARLREGYEGYLKIKVSATGSAWQRPLWLWGPNVPAWNKTGRFYAHGVQQLAQAMHRLLHQPCRGR
jgi:glycosyltransferase involved in cell wall biosynthesis